MTHTFERTTLTARIDAGDRWKHRGDTGVFWVDQVFWSPLQGHRRSEVRVRGTAIKQDGNDATFNREGRMQFVALPVFVREALVGQMHIIIDGLNEAIREARASYTKEAD